MDLEIFKEASDKLGQINTVINEQNQRYESAEEITDQEFRAMAVGGLAMEQQVSLEERQAIANEIDFEQVLSGWDVLLAQREALLIQKDTYQAMVADVLGQADMTIKIAPNMETEVRRLAQEKTSGLQSDIQAIETTLAEVTNQELGFVAIAQPWIIPGVPQPKEVSQPETASAPAATEVIQEECVAEPFTAEDDKARLKSVLWAVYDYVEKSGQEGARLEDMRKVVAELVDLSESEYNYFKSNFSQMREHIVTMLSGMGLTVSWETTGRTRGTRYHVKEVQRPVSNSFMSEPFTPIAVEDKESEPVRVVTTDIEPGSIKVEEPVTQVLPEVDDTPKVESVPDINNDPEKDSEEPTALVAKQLGGSNMRGSARVVQVPLGELHKHLNIKKDPQLVKEFGKWAKWLMENPSVRLSTRKIRSLKGLRIDDTTEVVNLFRFSPKDAPGLTVPKQYIRQRVVFAYVGEQPVFVDVLDHDSFDRKYN